MKGRAKAAAALLAGALVLRAALASGGEIDTGVAADRFVPAGPGGGALLAVEGSGVSSVDRPAISIAISGIQRPLVIVNRFTGALISQPVTGMLTADVAGEVALWSGRIAIGLGVPVTLWAAGDRLAGLGVDERPLQTPLFGDIRLRVKVRLARSAGGVGLAALLVATLPGGGERDFAATSGPTLEPRLIVDYGHRWFGAAINLGVHLAPDRTLFETRLGSELHWAAGVLVGGGGATVPRGLRLLRLLVEAEGWIGPSRGARPVELRGALRVVLGQLSVDLGAGGGLDRDIGAPAWRLLAVARWVR